MKTVAEFTETGQVTYLPDLQEGRYWHACSKFVDDSGETVSFFLSRDYFVNSEA